MDRAKERALRREAFLDAAIAVISDEGPGASMESIAQAAGVSKPILYRHFTDREGLIEALAERFVGELADRLAEILSADIDPVEMLRLSIDAYVATIEDDPSLYRFLTSRIPPRGAALSTLVDRLAAVIARTLAEAFRAAGLDTAPARPWSYGIVGMVHLAGDDWVARPAIPRAELVDDLIRLLWDGIAGVAVQVPDPSAWRSH
ncbi:MAG TPA: TetR/AcrR family transcriptional regulator [Acidimicrobiales bacterium]|nr:TetR/AcrR family transcriptional regulator [Acidimicrobiales bacterium]